MTRYQAYSVLATFPASISCEDHGALQSSSRLYRGKIHNAQMNPEGSEPATLESILPPVHSTLTMKSCETVE
ncbi:hypothetical protein KM043_005511 [Ampulex compressa]|nr:hypothetical protein KM043_005511 [Ampulex compressa]